MRNVCEGMLLYNEEGFTSPPEMLVKGPTSAHNRIGSRFPCARICSSYPGTNPSLTMVFIFKHKHNFISRLKSKVSIVSPVHASK